MSRTSIVWSLVALLAACAGPATAATITVVPGPGTPVQDAIDAASPGDTVRLAGGGYPESIVVTKPLKIVGPKGSPIDNEPQAAVIAPGCVGTTTGITVASDDVKIRDLRVLTFTQYGIDIQGRTRVSVTNVMALPNCPPSPPIATLNVVASTRVKVDGCWMDGFDVPAIAIHLASIPEAGHVRITRTLGGSHDVNFLIEDCLPGSVNVSRSYANFANQTGILLRNSDGIVLKKNAVGMNPVSGIELDANSDDNRILGNDIHDSAADVVDNGTGNCWKNNTFVTGSVPPCP